MGTYYMRGGKRMTTMCIVFYILYEYVVLVLSDEHIGMLTSYTGLHKSSC